MIVWSVNFETKIDVIDVQHKNMFGLLNRLINNVNGGNVSSEYIDDTLQLLIHHTKNNFHDEELLMLESRIDSRHMSKHRMEHQSFLYDIDRYNEHTAAYDRRVTAKVEKLIRFMTFWLTFHTLGTDLHMAAQLDNIKLGMSPQQAFESLKHQKLDLESVNMIQEALLNLWLESKDNCLQLEKKCARMEDKLVAMEIELQSLTLNQ